MIDLKELAAIVANILGGVAILAVVIFAVVAWLKQMGVRGKWLTGSAFLLGLVIAMFVRYALSPAQSFSDWVWTALFGLMAGLLATGAYKGVESASGKTQLMEGELLEFPQREGYIDDDDMDASVGGYPVE